VARLEDQTGNGGGEDLDAMKTLLCKLLSDMACGTMFLSIPDTCSMSLVV
jgi:hypothetical protein